MGLFELLHQPRTLVEDPPIVQIQSIGGSRIPDCHPKNKHYAKGLCESCYKHSHYKGEIKSTPKRMSDCHPDRKHQAHGLCARCYAKNNQLKYKETLWRHIGIKDFSFQEYEKLLKKQSGVCAICGDSPGSNRLLCVDHDHNTGKVRGLLCDFCNTKLVSSKHSVELLLKAVVYLRGNE